MKVEITIATEMVENLKKEIVESLDVNYEKVASWIDYQELGQAVDESNIAEHIDLHQLASELDHSEIANEIEVDLSELSELVAERIDGEEIAGHIDTQEIADALNLEIVAKFIDTKKIAMLIKEQVQEEITDCDDSEMKEILKKKTESMEKEAKEREVIRETLIGIHDLLIQLKVKLDK